MHTRARLSALGALALSASAVIPARADTTHPVSIPEDRVFSPTELSVAVGDTVTWTNSSTEDHNVRGGPFSSPRMAPDGTFSHTFTKAGSVAYVCDFHPSMKGRITVS